MGKIGLDKWCIINNKEYILEEWDYSKNTSIAPQDVSRGSEKNVWWRCSEGHEWEARVNSRTKNDPGCPYCSGRFVVVGKNDFQTKFPTLASEWHPTKNGNLKPFDILPSSNKKVWWLCNKGHSYEAKVGNRTYLNRGCPYCSGNKLLPGYNDFETWCKKNGRQDLLDEWDYEKNSENPSEITKTGGGKKFWWKGSCGHVWDSVISSRVRTREGKTKMVKPAGCPYCSNPPKRILLGFNDLKTWCAKENMNYIIDEWDYEKNDSIPEDYSYGSGKKVWWKCEKGHRWQSTISNRTSTDKTGCPVCARTQTSFPEQAIAFYLSKKVEILQRVRIKGYEVDIYIPKNKIAIEYDGLLWHSGDEKENKDFEKTQNVIKAGNKLIRVKESGKYKSYSDGDLYIIEYDLKGKNYINNEFEKSLKELIKLISILINKTLNIDVDIERDELEIQAYYKNTLKNNSVAAVFPELISEWDIEKNHGIKPDVFSARNNQKVWWKCEHGHSWSASINTRTVRKLGCPFCAGQRVVNGLNDFETWCNENDRQELLMEWDDEKNIDKPNEIPRTYKKKVWWKCSEGHEWEATVYNRVNGTCCPVCNTGNNVRRNKITLRKWCIQNNPELLAEWNYEKNKDLTPDDVTYGSHKKAWWKCLEGHEWEAQIKSRRYNHGCPYCSKTNKKVQEGVNDLKTWCINEDKQYILDEWDYVANGDLKPEMFTKGSHKVINWICKNGHCWTAPIKARTQVSGNQCPICGKL